MLRVLREVAARVGLHGFELVNLVLRQTQARRAAHAQREARDGQHHQHDDGVTLQDLRNPPRSLARGQSPRALRTKL